MNVIYSTLDDFEAWIALARQVEPLFGPMADEAPFRDALKSAISNREAFCIRPLPGEKQTILKGGIVVSKASNEILWFAVSEKDRRKGYGRQLLLFAIDHLHRREKILVETFAATVGAGQSARKLYLDCGFVDETTGGINPAGVPTVIMQLSGLP